MIKKIIIKFAVLAFLMSNASFADIKFWTTEVQPARMAKQQEMAKRQEVEASLQKLSEDTSFSALHLCRSALRPSLPLSQAASFPLSRAS